MIFSKLSLAMKMDPMTNLALGLFIVLLALFFLSRYLVETKRELLLARKEIKYQWEISVRDGLTQIYNRRHFETTLPLEIKRCERFSRELSLLMIDLDQFKGFNDRFGHLAGDACLKEFVTLVNKRIRQFDFFARFGGEEFVVILPSTSKKAAVIAAEKIRVLVRGHRFVAPGSAAPVLLTVSIGVASYPEDGQTMEELVENADTALYEAKRAGRDRVVIKRPLPFSNLPKPPVSSEGFAEEKPGETSA